MDHVFHQILHTTHYTCGISGFFNEKKCLFEQIGAYGVIYLSLWLLGSFMEEARPGHQEMDHVFHQILHTIFCTLVEFKAVIEST